MPNGRFMADVAYLLLLGATLGAVLVLGAFAAPVVFNTPMLERFDEGVIMAEIFRRFTYWLYVAVAAVVLYEGYQFKIFKRDMISVLAALSLLGTALLFNTVYTPRILQMQQEGIVATQSEIFANIHTASELDFKLLATALLVLFVRRYYVITHPKR